MRKSSLSPALRAVTGLQQLDDLPLHLLRRIIAREILPQRLGFDANLLFLIGLFLGKNGVQHLRRQLCLVGDLLHAE